MPGRTGLPPAFVFTRRNPMKIAFAAVLAVGGFGLAGCSTHDGAAAAAMNNPFKKYTKEEQLAAAASRGYKEIRRENVIYVVSSPDAVKRVSAGDEPALKVSAI